MKPYAASFLLFIILNGCVATPVVELALLLPDAAPAAQGSTERLYTATNTVSPDMIEDGIAVYREQYCGVCHLLTVAGTGGSFGPSHDNMGTTSGERILSPDYKGSATTDAEFIRESINDPKAYIAPEYRFSQHAMPAYSHLAEHQIDALVQLLLSQRID